MVQRKITINPFPGENISDTLDWAYNLLKNELVHSVVFKFNGKEVVVSEEVSKDEVLDLYFKKMENEDL